MEMQSFSNRTQLFAGRSLYGRHRVHYVTAAAAAAVAGIGHLQIDNAPVVNSFSYTD